MLGLLQKLREIRVAVGVEQAKAREVSFRAELLGRGGEQQQSGRLPRERLDKRILRARLRRAPFEVMCLVHDEQIPARAQRLSRPHVVACKKRDAANDELAVE